MLDCIRRLFTPRTQVSGRGSGGCIVGYAAAFGYDMPFFVEHSWGSGGSGAPTSWGCSKIFYEKDGSRTIQTTVETSFETLHRSA